MVSKTQSGLVFIGGASDPEAAFSEAGEGDESAFQNWLEVLEFHCRCAAGSWETCRGGFCEDTVCHPR